MTVTADTLANVSVAALVTAMLTDDSHNQKYTLVVGLGLTGLSVVRHLKTLDPMQVGDIVVVDSREQPPGMDELQRLYPDVAMYCGHFDDALFMGAEQLIVSPGVALAEPAIQHALHQGVAAVGDIELFAQQVKAPVIAITGSNGKSTVTTLVGEMAKQAGLQVAVGGNIGVPALDLLQQTADLYVLELSSFQLETVTSLRPVAATVLNVSPDHMDRYDSYDDYVKVKQWIYHHCKHAVINKDDERTRHMATGQKMVSGFSLHEPAIGDFGLRQMDGETWLCKGGQKLISEKQLTMGGRHNTANALAALALGQAANIPMGDMLQAVSQFTGLPHRTQWVAEKQDVVWYNDSKGTNVGATLAAIEGLQVENKLILIAGGQAKDADFKPLKAALANKARLVVLIGEDAPQLEQALDGTVPVLYASDMDDAVQIAANLAHQGDSVLLSPACASFDMFRGFVHRGECFIKAVEALE